jgi:hypothetical protein
MGFHDSMPSETKTLFTVGRRGSFGRIGGAIVPEGAGAACDRSQAA